LTQERARPVLVIDAGAALHIVSAARPAPGLDRFDLIAPPNYPSERTSALAAAIFRGAIPDSSLDMLFARLEDLPVTIADKGKTHRRAALDLARSLGWAKTYDAEYVALAVRFSCELLTTDERLARGASRVVRIRRPTSLMD
jgi:predicted nucleic acid-binding protein